MAYENEKILAYLNERETKNGDLYYSGFDAKTRLGYSMWRSKKNPKQWILKTNPMQDRPGYEGYDARPQQQRRDDENPFE